MNNTAATPAPRTDPSLFLYRGLGCFDEEDHESRMPNEEERRRARLDQRLEDYLADTGGERKIIQGLFSKVLEEVQGVHTEMADIRQDVKGVKARVTLLEIDKEKKQSMAPKDTRKIEETYEKTPTGTYRLTDFELHDIHKDAMLLRSIKSFARAALIPVTAAIVLAGLAAIYVAVWHPPGRMAMPVPAATWQQQNAPTPTPTPTHP